MPAGASASRIWVRAFWSTEDSDEAVGIAMRLDGFNTERRALEKAVLNDALDQAEAAMASDPSLIMVASEDWHPGVIGIVASRLVDRFHRPAVVVSLTDGGPARVRAARWPASIWARP